ncbi:MAG: DEAD/DEAH box helicase [Desulfobacterales bacterium]|nr:DEAD/DEAH box helicase [Desulfobacterales bacterium]
MNPSIDHKLTKIFESIGVPEKTPFKPDNFQLEALKIIEDADCLVTAPTGSGKTWIAVKAIEKIFNKGGKSWYASPLKALSNSKFMEFSEIFGIENIGILTGDRRDNPDASILVGTTEILRNQLYDAMHKGINLDTDFIILDEAHYLGDEDRGVVWEEIMIYLPQRIPILMLSATVGNADQIAKWLSSIRKTKCIVVQETKRPVSLYPLFFYPSGKLVPLTVKGKNGKNQLYKKVEKYLTNTNPPVLSTRKNLPPMPEIISVLREYNLLPAIFFLKSRADCDNAVELCSDYAFDFNPEKKAKLENRISELSKQVSYIENHKQIWHLTNLGVGSHHSGQLPAWKLILETLMTEGLLDAVFATTTVAAGVNFPARTIILLNSDTFNGREFMPLTSTQFHQMTGRAGRRGMDNIGFAMTVPGKYMDVKLISSLLSAPPTSVLSQIKINFSMVLNLLLSHTPIEIQELLHKSFANYLISIETSKKKSRHNELKKDLWNDFLQHLYFLKNTGYVNDDNTLTEDGIWASQLRIDHPLLIAEGFRLKIFPEADPVLLASIMAPFVNDRDLEINVKRDVDQKIEKLFNSLKQALTPFVKYMISCGFEVAPIYLHPAITIHAWASGETWEEVIEISKMAEGDLAKLILRTADNLRHIKNLAGVFPETAKNAEQAIDLIMKDPVLLSF